MTYQGDDTRAVTVIQAATVMGITTEAVRQRLKRKTLEGFKDNKGRLMVYLPATEQTDISVPPSGQTATEQSDRLALPSDRSGEVEALKVVIQAQAAHIETLQAQLVKIEAQADREREDRKAAEERLAAALDRLIGLAEAKATNQAERTPGAGKRLVVTAELVSQIAAMKREGMTTRAIADRLDVSKGTVSNALAKAKGKR